MEQWRRLRCDNDKLPPMHVKATSNSDGYSIRLTDLSRVWSETLRKGDILERARRRNCSIDPSEDDEQFSILLEKLKSALSQSDGTTAALSSTRDGGLKLHLEAPLPKPLPAFQWEVRLEPASDAIIGDEIVGPLLRQLDTLTRQRQSLLAEIQAKDKIVYKLTDRLETSGHRMQEIFPGVSKVTLARGKSLREGLGRYVRGLGEFDEHAWAAQFEVKPDTTHLPSGSVDDILASLPVQSIDAEGARATRDWWKNIPADQQIELGEAAAEKEGTIRRHVLDRPSDSTGLNTPEVIEDDEFQRQATPPRLRAQPPPSAGQEDVDMHEAGDDSTEDEDDLDGPSQKTSKPDSKPAKHNIVDTAPAVEPKAVSPPPPPKSNHEPQPPTNYGISAYDDEDTEDEDGDDLDAPSQSSKKAATPSQLPSRQKSQSPQPTASTATSPPRKRLGTLGGRARTKSPAVDQLPPSNSVPREPTPPVTSPKPKPKSKLGTLGGSKTKRNSNPPSPKSKSPPPAKKLGTIGGKRTAASTVTSDCAATASATPEPPQQSKESNEIGREEAKVEPEEPVNVEERANAKRDALKRELEAKAKAPVKKKRKF